MSYIDTANMPLHMPVPGSREPAQIALLNENCVVLSTHTHLDGQGLGVARLRGGAAASRPAAGQAGATYFATDTGVFSMDTGTAWVDSMSGQANQTVTGWTLVDPTVRDAVNFGAEGGTGFDVTLARSAAKVLTLSGSLVITAEAAEVALQFTGQTALTTAVAGAAPALPATPEGYLKVKINGTDMKIPYYKV